MLRFILAALSDEGISAPRVDLASSSVADEVNSTPRVDLAKRLKTNTVNQGTCPVSFELMVDPVIAQDGNSYERIELLTWLQDHTTSPLDPSTQLSASALIPNRALRGGISRR